MITKFHNFTIIHPKQGKVSRSVVSTLFIEEAKEYKPNRIYRRTRSEKAKGAALYLAKHYPATTVILEADGAENIKIKTIF